MLFIALVAFLEINDPQVTVSCTGVVESCREAPATPWDRPSCDEYNLNTALLESAERGDRSAIELLRQRYATTFTYAERFRIGGALLGRVRDDRAIWNELSAPVEKRIDLADDDARIEAYCAEHGYERDAFEGMAWSAF